MKFNKKDAYENCKGFYDELNVCLNLNNKIGTSSGKILEQCENNYINLGECTSKFYFNDNNFLTTIEPKKKF